jgi:dolichol-phosphate mannosyltransferase
MQPTGYKILVEVLARGKCRVIEEVPFEFVRREQGESKVGLGTTWKFLRQIGQLALATDEVPRMIKFGIIGVSGVVVNVFGYWLLRRSGYAVTAAAAAAAALASVNNFVWNEIYTFQYVPRGNVGVRATTRRLVRFGGLSLVGLILNTVSVSVLEPLTGWPAGLFAGISLASGWNFFSNSNLTWYGRSEAGSLAGSSGAKAADVAAESDRRSWE